MKRARPFRTRRAERGVAAVVFVIVVPVLLGLIGLAVDLGRLYARRTELQGMADEVALAAASKLDGTTLGIRNARIAAIAVQKDSYYDQGIQWGIWNNAALSFANSPYATDWTPYDDAIKDPAPGRLLYVKVDSTQFESTGDYALGALPKSLSTILPGVSTDPFNLTSVPAVAGKLVSPITPLAVCAISKSPTGSHINNSVGADPLTYGFRTGVSYNLLALSNSGQTTAQRWLVNPVDATPTDPNNQTDYNSTSHFGPKYMRAFLCSGTVGLGQVAGRDVYLQAIPTNLDDLKSQTGVDVVSWLNSRFGDTGCDSVAGAPPDSNVREFYGNFNGNYPQWYMKVTQYPQPAAYSTVRAGPPSQLVAFPNLAYQNDSQSSIPVPTELSFGPLWAYSKPSGFTASQWPNMYQYTPPGKPVDLNGPDTKFVQASTNYPASLPYKAHVTAPANGGGVADRRVLNIPLLDCDTVTPDSAHVLAIGRFFMTGRASSTIIPGEFAGTYNLATTAVLYR
jgi:Flp pilus assembly protein TadG